MADKPEQDQPAIEAAYLESTDEKPSANIQIESRDKPVMSTPNDERYEGSSSPTVISSKEENQAPSMSSFKPPISENCASVYDDTSSQGSTKILRACSLYKDNSFRTETEGWEYGKHYWLPINSLEMEDMIRQQTNSHRTPSQSLLMLSEVQQQHILGHIEEVQQDETDDIAWTLAAISSYPSGAIGNNVTSFQIVLEGNLRPEWQSPFQADCSQARRTAPGLEDIEERKFTFQMRMMLYLKGFSKAAIDSIIGDGPSSEHDYGIRMHDAAPFERPPYMKVSRRHMSRESLDAYYIPWMYDDVS